MTQFTPEVALRWSQCPQASPRTRAPAPNDASQILVPSTFDLTLVDSDIYNEDRSHEPTLVSPEPDSEFKAKTIDSLPPVESRDLNIHDFIGDVQNPVTKLAIRVAPLNGPDTEDAFHFVHIYDDGTGDSLRCRDFVDDLDVCIHLRGPLRARDDLLRLASRGFKSQDSHVTGPHGEVETLLTSMRATLGVNHRAVIKLESALRCVNVDPKLVSDSSTNLLSRLVSAGKSFSADDLARILSFATHDDSRPDEHTEEHLQLGVCKTLQKPTDVDSAVYAVEIINTSPRHPKVDSVQTIWMVYNKSHSSDEYSDAVASGNDYGEAKISRWSAMAPDNRASRPSYAAVVAGSPSRPTKREHSPEHLNKPLKKAMAAFPTQRNTNLPLAPRPTSAPPRRTLTYAEAVTGPSINDLNNLVCRQPDCRYNPESRNWNKKSFKTKKTLEYVLLSVYLHFYSSCIHIAALRRHVRDVHNTSEAQRPIGCTFDRCPRRFFYQKDLDKHIKVHNGSNVYRCEVECCKASERGTRIDNMRRHYMTFHPDVPMPSYLLTKSRGR